MQLFQIEVIIETESGVLGSTAAVNLVDQLPKDKKMSKHDSQALLEKLENSKWINNVSLYYIIIRSFEKTGHIME